MLSLLLLPIPTTMEAMVLATEAMEAMVLDTEAMVLATGAMEAMVLVMEAMEDTVATMASVRLRLSPQLMLSLLLLPIPTTMEAMVLDTEAMELATGATEAMVLDMEAMEDTVDTMASVRLRPSLRLMLIPTMAPTMEAMDWAMEAMGAMDSATAWATLVWDTGVVKKQVQHANDCLMPLVQMRKYK